MSEKKNNMAASETTGTALIEMLSQSRLFRGVPMDTIAHIEGRAIGGHHLVAGERAHAHQFGAQLPVGTGDEHPHQRPALALSGSHHQRLSRYHCTVSAIDTSNVRCIFQPSALILSMFTE